MPSVLSGSDWVKRRPLAAYTSWATQESVALALNSQKNLISYVVCAGLLYGNGESLFKDLFKR
jgi:hypothetical protein